MRQALADWPRLAPPPTDVSTPIRRLLSAAQGTENGTAGKGDLAVLLRHVLRSTDEIGGNGLIEIPADPLWPDEATLARHGLESAVLSAQQVSVTASPWRPAWLGVGGDDSDPAALAYRGTWNIARPLEEVQADPFFEHATGFSTYRSPGQREAVRALLTVDHGGTVIAALPTGSGKSLVAYLDALMRRQTGCTVVVVPTVSLAIDQERAFLELVVRQGRKSEYPNQLAYYGELPDGAREEIRRRIRDGIQPIVFTSPESVVQSLSPALFSAAENGLLRLFVVDEAHIVSEWGPDFRPAFQAIGGLQRALRDAGGDHHPIRTLLLSGTVTDEVVETLERLFGSSSDSSSKFVLVGAVDLRAEPSYWLNRAASQPERQSRIHDALRHLPRPLILYTTTVADAERWHTQVREAGYLRSALVSGRTQAAQRRDVIGRLREGALDLVVATSAFGLGVDQPDVRAVVHACIPETLNRYYQEVGRGGRDGNPSIAVLVAAPADDRIARSLANKRLISFERGHERWEAMIQRASDEDRNRFRLLLSVAPPDLSGDNDENRRWNLRTLLVMDRAGLVRLEAEAPPKLGEDATEDEWQAAFEEHAAHAVVRLVAGNLAESKPWEDCFVPAREEGMRVEREAHERMKRAMQSGTRLCELFAETYTLRDPFAERTVKPDATCGGCPGCRRSKRWPRFFPQHRPRPLRGVGIRWDPVLASRFGGHSVLVLYYDPENDWPRAVEHAVVRLAGLGMRSVWSSRKLRSWPEVARVHLIAGPIFMDDLPWLRLTAPDVPTTVVHQPGSAPQTLEFQAAGPQRILMVPDTARHPDHPSLPVHRYAPSVLGLRRFLKEF